MDASTFFNNMAESLFYIQLFLTTILIILSFVFLIYFIRRKEKKVLLPILFLLFTCIGTTIYSIDFDTEINLNNMLSTYESLIIFLIIIFTISSIFSVIILEARKNIHKN